ncbi:MAG: glutaredoxin family protein [Methylococcaceae bacterium]
MITLILLGTSGCHLCEEAELIMAACEHINIDFVDIAEQEQWQEKYAIRIPVLFHTETEKELGWPFTITDVQIFIKELSSD